MDEFELPSASQGDAVRTHSGVRNTAAGLFPLLWTLSLGMVTEGVAEPNGARGGIVVQPGAPARGEIIARPIVSATMYKLEGPPPRDFIYLRQQARHLSEDTREEYLARWRSFVQETVDCDSEAKLAWFIHFAAWTTHSEIKSENAAVIEKLALENPRCLLRGIREEGLPMQRLQSYLIQPTHHELSEIDAVLRTVLDEPEFEEFARHYVARFNAHQQRLEAERLAREQRLAAEGQRYWTALQDPAFYAESEGAYWQRWRELISRAGCQDLEKVQYLFEAAAKNADIEAIRAEGARVVEEFTLRDPACVLRAMEGLGYATALVEHYLVASSRVEELHAALAGVAATSDQSWKVYKRAYEQYRYRIADPVTPPDEFLWSVKLFESDLEGRVFVPATYIKGHSEFQDRLDRMWAQTADGDIRDWRGDPIKLLPLSSLNFMTLGRFGTYYLLNFTRDGLEVVKARPVKAALSRWACGDVASLLLLEPERTPGWLVQTGHYPVVSGAVELRDDLPPPTLGKHEWPDERYFFRGGLGWVDGERIFDVSYTAAYVGIHFEVTDQQAGKKHMAREFSDYPCH